MQNKGWPFPDKPGVPVNPERDGWHWLQNGHDGPIPVAWLSGSQTWEGYGRTAMVGHYNAYVAPCLTPAEVAEEIADTKREAWNEGYAQGVANAHAQNGDKWAVNALQYSSPAEVEAAERRGYELAGCASADAIPSIAKLIERAQLALSEPPLTMCEALARDVTLKPLAMECAAAVEKARAEEREEIAVDIDCGYRGRAEVLSQLAMGKEHNAANRCDAGRGFDCCALQAAAIRARGQA